MSLRENKLDDRQRAHLEQIKTSCESVLKDLEGTIEDYKELERKDTSGKARVKRVWKRIKWGPDDSRDLRARITSNITQINAFLAGVLRYASFFLSTSSSAIVIKYQAEVQQPKIIKDKPGCE